MRDKLLLERERREEMEAEVARLREALAGLAGACHRLDYEGALGFSDDGEIGRVLWVAGYEWEDWQKAYEQAKAALPTVPQEEA
jgi:hypothetical protein